MEYVFVGIGVAILLAVLGLFWVVFVVVLLAAVIGFQIFCMIDFTSDVYAYLVRVHQLGTAYRAVLWSLCYAVPPIWILYGNIVLYSWMFPKKVSEKTEELCMGTEGG